MSKVRSEDVKTGLCRFAFTHGLFKLQETQRGTKQWTVTLLFPKKSPDLEPLYAVALAAAKEAWGDRAEQMIEDKVIKTPFLDGDGPQGRSKSTGEPHAGFPGHIFIRCTSGEEYRPKLVDRNVLPITSPEQFYSGCYGYAVVHAYTWNSEQGKGISFGITMAQFVKDGEPLGSRGGGAPENYFEKVPDEGGGSTSAAPKEGAAALFG